MNDVRPYIVVSITSQASCPSSYNKIDSSLRNTNDQIIVDNVARDCYDSSDTAFCLRPKARCCLPSRISAISFLYNVSISTRQDSVAPFQSRCTSANALPSISTNTKSRYSIPEVPSLIHTKSRPAQDNRISVVATLLASNAAQRRGFPMSFARLVRSRWMPLSLSTFTSMPWW